MGFSFVTAICKVRFMHEKTQVSKKISEANSKRSVSSQSIAIAIVWYSSWNKSAHNGICS